MSELFNNLLYLNAFQYFSALCYVGFCFALLKMAVRHHTAVTRKEEDVGQFPPGYFTMLATSLVPMAITGYVLGDEYLLLTRVVTLVIVLFSYTLTTCREDGTFETYRHQWAALFWLSVIMILPMLSVQYAPLRGFVHDYESYVAWGADAAMILFVVKGQWSVAKTLFLHYLKGSYSFRRLSIQGIRFLGFFTQAIHYWHFPSIAKPFLGFDPIFLQGALGAGGIFFLVFGGAAWGLIRGILFRKRLREPEPQLA